MAIEINMRSEVKFTKIKVYVSDSKGNSQELDLTKKCEGDDCIELFINENGFFEIK